MEIRDCFKGITGITASKYDKMTWEEALAKLFSRLPNRTTLELETAKQVAVIQCRKGDIWHKYPTELPTEDGDYLITVTYWSQIISDYIEDEVMMDSYYSGSFSIENRFKEHPVTIKSWAYKPEAYKEGTND